MTRRFVLALSLGVLAYNSLISFVVSPLVSVPFNLLLGVGVVTLGCVKGLRAHDMGLSDERYGPRLAFGALLGAAALIGAAFFSWKSDTSQFGGGDLRDLEGWGLAFKLLIHVPIATSLVEEVAFRGVLFAAWRQVSGATVAILGTSAVYALWHVPSTLAKVPSGDPLVTMASLGATGGAVLGTFLLGIALGYLRHRTGSIWAGVPFHAGFNAGGVVGAVLKR